MKGKFKCTSVSRQAFNDEKVVLEHPEATIIVHNKKTHGAFVVGKEYPVAIGGDHSDAEKSSNAKKSNGKKG